MSGRALLLLTSALVVLGSGCGRAQKPVPVSGVLLEEGRPVADARVTFNPVEGTGRIAFGTTDSEGRFRLTTFNHNDGALPGRYKITVTVSGPAQEADPSLVTDRQAFFREQERLRNRKVPQIHENYTNLAKTPLVAEIPTEGELLIELNKNGT
jgi:hypothetical protein